MNLYFRCNNFGTLLRDGWVNVLLMVLDIDIVDILSVAVFFSFFSNFSDFFELFFSKYENNERK
jgi:hypothetical protein